jgi:hypothetical protein
MGCNSWGMCPIYCIIIVEMIQCIFNKAVQILISLHFFCNIENHILLFKIMFVLSNAIL